MELRYYIEHVVLPTLVRDSADRLVATIAEGKEEFIATLFKTSAQGLNQESKYTKDDFHIDLVKYDKYFCQIIKMPDEESYPPLCPYIFISINETHDFVRYFTIERGSTALLFCEWRNNKHYAYGKFNPDEDPLKKIKAIREQTDESAKKEIEEAKMQEAAKEEENKQENQ